MISVVSAMLSNPIMMTMVTGMAGGTKITKVKGKKAIAEWDAQQKHGSIKMIVANRALITITGSDCQESDIQAYAGTIDYNKIQSFVSE